MRVLFGSCRRTSPGGEFFFLEKNDYPPLGGGAVKWLSVGEMESPGGLNPGEGSWPGAGCQTDLRHALALLPTPARRSLLPSSKFRGQAGTPDVPAGEGGKREELGAAPSSRVPGPGPTSNQG